MVSLSHFTDITNGCFLSVNSFFLILVVDNGGIRDSDDSSELDIVKPQPPCAVYCPGGSDSSGISSLDSSVFT